MMSTSLDIYSFGMVVLFLFSERNHWKSSPTSSPTDIAAREQQVNTLVANMESRVGLQEIAQQVRAMLNSDPTCRPTEATDCSFELLSTHQDV